MGRTKIFKGKKVKGEKVKKVKRALRDIALLVFLPFYSFTFTLLPERKPISSGVG